MPYARKRASFALGLFASAAFLLGGATENGWIVWLSVGLYLVAIVSYLRAKGRRLAWSAVVVVPLFGLLLIALLADYREVDLTPRPRALRRSLGLVVACTFLTCTSVGVGVLVFENFKLFQARVQARQLIEPLERYHLAHGRYPDALADLEEARILEPDQLRLIHYELHDRGDAFFVSCREGADQHKWHVYDSRIGRWQSR